MSLKDLAYRFAPKSLVTELRHRKHLSDLTTAVEPEESSIEPLILPGYTVLDIGANFGVFTKLFSRLVGPAGSVIAFEPVPQTFRTLASGVERFRLKNVKVVNKAVSDSVGKVLMTVPQYQESKGENLYEARIVRDADAMNAFTVETLTVDSLQVPHVNFIKIDVEGHELEVLRGAVETLRTHRPTLMVEVSGQHTTEFLCGELDYKEPLILSPSNQLFTPR